MARSESEILADVYENVRGLSKFYLSDISKIDIHKRIEADGIKFNSAYWIAAHLAWTEHSLILNGVAGEDMKIDWLDDYAYGSDPDQIKNNPPIEEILKKLDEIHIRAVDIIRNLSEEQLEEDNLFGESFGDSKSKRIMIIHAIRHEPMHIGQLSWILKTNGIKYA